MARQKATFSHGLLDTVIDFSDWQLGPCRAFEDQWANPRFKAQSQAFLSKFVNNTGTPVENPSLLCRRESQIDGQPPTPDEIQALESAIAFAFLDKNPRHTAESQQQAWSVLTADNTELFIWPIDVDAGNVTVTTGLMVRTLVGGFRITDTELSIRPALDLHMPQGGHTADPTCLEAVYKAVLQSLATPGESLAANRLRVAIGWFVKAWRNAGTLHFPERLVFLKTAFEALTGTSKSYQSARFLRELFEALPDTSPDDSEILVWSPSETPTREWTYIKGGKEHTDQVTDLELWFMKFGDARNTIIHQGIVPSLDYTGPNPRYHGHFVFTAEFLLRAAVKVSLGMFGYDNLWRSDAWRAIKAACEEFKRRQGAGDTTEP